MSDIRKTDMSERRSSMAAAATLVAVGCGAVLGWALSGTGQRPQSTALFKAPAVAAATTPASVPQPSKSPLQPPAAGTVPSRPATGTPVDAWKQVPRVDLVIDYLADERGHIDPCG